ncbi:MAG: hypothetical protein ACTHZX_01720 [Microbacterium sp.]
MSYRPAAPQRPAGRARALAAALLAALLVLIGVNAPATVSAAESSGVTVTISYGGETYGGTKVVTPGTSYTARVQYSVPNITPGGTVTIAVPDGITVPAEGLVVPAGNTVVKSMELDGDGDVVLTFLEEPDSTINQGVIGFDFVFDEPEQGTEIQEITWLIGGEEQTVTVIMKKPGDDLRPDFPSAEGKSVGDADLHRFVSIADGVVAVDPAIADAAISYTLAVDSAEARTGLTITDTLSEYLEYADADPTATLTTWDGNGLNKTTSDFALPELQLEGGVATLAGIDLPAHSTLRISYQAHVRADKVEALRAALQEKVDAVGEDGGWVQLELGNTATFDGTEKTGVVTVGVTVPGPPVVPGPELVHAFVKKSSLSGETEIALTEDGALAAPVDLTYTLRADLTRFAGFEGATHELKRNVVVVDELPAQIDWAGGDFLSVVDGGLDLREVSADVSEADFAGDDHVGAYQVSGDGKTLRINVGQDTTKTHEFAAKASIVSVAGLDTWRSGDRPTVESFFKATNVAYFHYSDDRDPHRAPVDTVLYVPVAPGSSVDDGSRFRKWTDDDISVTSGTAAELTFDFAVEQGAVSDLRASRIIDEIDHDVFDVSDLDAIRDSITGSFGWEQALTGDDFDLELNEAGELVITLSDTFGENLAWGQTLAPATDRLAFSLVLPTKALEGKQTLDITNTARVEGESQEDYVWVSEAKGSASSWGDELELNKTIYAGDGEWTKNLRVGVDEDGQPAQDEFLYRIMLLPHGEYHSVAILDIDDVLPAGLEFAGFVTEGAVGDASLGDVGAVDVASTDGIDMGGDIRATWNGDGTVEIRQLDGTVLPDGATSQVIFKVKATDVMVDHGVTNAIGGESATFTPTDGFPLLIQKKDAANPDLRITDRDSRFTVTGPEGEIVTDEAYVVDGTLVVAAPDGEDRAVIVPIDPENPDVVPAGDYTVTERIAPEGYQLTDVELVVTLKESGASDAGTLWNTPCDGGTCEPDEPTEPENPGDTDEPETPGEPEVPGDTDEPTEPTAPDDSEDRDVPGVTEEDETPATERGTDEVEVTSKAEETVAAKETDELAVTGLALPTGLFALGSLLLAGGALLIARRRETARG